MSRDIIVGSHQSLIELFNTRRATLEQVMPKRSHLTFERVLKIVIAATMRSPQLLQCTRESVWLAVQHAVELGLEPGSLLGHAYLVPFRNNKTGTTDCTLIVGYQGLIQLIMRSGLVQGVRAEIVYKADQWDVQLGTSPSLMHKPELEAENRGPALFAYSVANIAGMGTHFIVASRADIEKRMRVSKSGFDRKSGAPSGVWAEWQEEMWRKTALRMHAKWLPMSTEIMGRLIETELDPTAGEMVAPIEEGASSMVAPQIGDAETVIADDNGESHSPTARTLARVRAKRASLQRDEENVAPKDAADISVEMVEQAALPTGD